MSQPTPLPDHIINITLQYLIPPTPPLPPHLLAKDLLQRHHFLGIDPSDSEAYFCWPRRGTDPSQIIRSLDLLAGNESLLDKRGHVVVYDADPETLRARVMIGDDVQAIFTWDSDDSTWKYHDAALSPFPPFASADLQVALAAIANEKSVVLELPHGEQERSSSPTSDDGYWDNYGASSQPSPEPSNNLALPTDTHLSAEDAYWASYSSVQGTADSTIPSPMVHPNAKARQLQASGHTPIRPSYDIDPYELTAEYEDNDGSYFSHPSHYNPDADRVMGAYVPPRDSESDEGSHAESLARALFPVKTYQDYQEGLDVDKKLPVVPGPSLGVWSPPQSDESPVRARSITLEQAPDPLADGGIRDGREHVVEEDAHVVEAIRGLYKLWASGKRRESGGNSSPNSLGFDSGEEDSVVKRDFLALVAKAVGKA